MKNVIRFKIASIALAMLQYSFAAFVNWDPSPENWGINARIFMAGLQIVGMLVTAIVIAETRIHTKSKTI